MPKTTNVDTIVEEIHEVRRRISEKFGGDLAAILDDARKRQAASGRVVWQGAQSKPSETTTLDAPLTESFQELILLPKTKMLFDLKGATFDADSISTSM